jgi:PEP-CTERM motif-containing protein
MLICYIGVISNRRRIMMPLPNWCTRFALVALLAALLPPAANALILTDLESLDGYAGLATVTVSRHGPTSSATLSGAASTSPSFVMGWMFGGNDNAHALMLASGDPAFAIDFGAMLGGSAPSSLGRHVFDLMRNQADLDIDDLHLAGLVPGDVASVLALAEGADDHASWESEVTQGIFTATYQLFLFTLPGGDTWSSGFQLVNANVVTNFETSVEANKVPEPDVLALIGIGLSGLALSFRRKRA